MSVTLIVKGRSYTVSFETFEKMLARTEIGNCIEIVGFSSGVIA